MEIFSSISPVLVWFIVGVVLFFAEMGLPGFVFFFFAIGAWCTALTYFFVPLELAFQLLVFLGTSLCNLFLLRSTLRRTFLGDLREKYTVESEIPAAVMGLVVEDIVPPAMGKVKYGGSFWIASADQQIGAGTQVTILKQENLVVTVAPLSKEEQT